MGHLQKVWRTHNEKTRRREREEMICAVTLPDHHSFTMLVPVYINNNIDTTRKNIFPQKGNYPIFCK